jgi:hypothetical protein
MTCAHCEAGPDGARPMIPCSCCDGRFCSVSCLEDFHVLAAARAVQLAERLDEAHARRHQLEARYQDALRLVAQLTQLAERLPDRDRLDSRERLAIVHGHMVCGEQLVTRDGRAVWTKAA